MEILNIIVLFIAGISFGSFINVVADRLPKGMSVLFPPSHCFNCQHKLESCDLMPVFSYIMLKGRCRYCQTLISPRTFLVELMTGIFFALALFKIGYSYYLVVLLFYICIFIILGIIRINDSRFCSITIYSALLITIIISLLNRSINPEHDFYYTLTGFMAGIIPAALIWLILKSRSHAISLNYLGLAGLTGAVLGIPLIILAVCVYLLIITLLKIFIGFRGKMDVIKFEGSGLIYSFCVNFALIIGDTILRTILESLSNIQ